MKISRSGRKALIPVLFIIVSKNGSKVKLKPVSYHIHKKNTPASIMRVIERIVLQCVGSDSETALCVLQDFLGLFLLIGNQFLYRIGRRIHMALAIEIGAGLDL